ncbi:MAG: tyrosine-type recombinase/integrase [Rudaea sp.]|nr:tyrosine-type recombinase/integrase [Rudaea sp.]
MAKRQSKVLSDQQIQRWIRAKTPIARADGDGLTFTLSVKGAAVWVLRYRYGGRRKELTLGRYPDMTLKTAREEASSHRLRINGGLDVAVEKQRRKTMDSEAWTVRQLVRDVESKVLPGLADLTQAQARSYIVGDLMPKFGAWVARDVTSDDVQAWLEAIATERSYYAASNARKFASLVFKHGLARRVVKENPFRAVDMRTVAHRPDTRARVKLNDSELRAFLSGLKGIAEQDALAFRLLLLTGVRAGELFGAEWTDIDLGAALWCIPKNKIKTRKKMSADSFIVPLPADAVAWLKRLHTLACGSRWVMPPRARIVDDRKSADYERALDRLKGYVETLGTACRPITFHDLRSTMRSHLSALGVRTEVAERAINHSLGGLIEIYDKGDYLDERKAALNKWAASLGALESGAGIVPFKRKAS